MPFSFLDSGKVMEVSGIRNGLDENHKLNPIESYQWQVVSLAKVMVLICFGCNCIFLKDQVHT